MMVAHAVAPIPRVRRPNLPPHEVVEGIHDIVINSAGAVESPRLRECLGPRPPRPKAEILRVSPKY
jgi:hypothetical protein